MVIKCKTCKGLILKKKCRADKRGSTLQVELVAQGAGTPQQNRSAQDTRQKPLAPLVLAGLGERQQQDFAYKQKRVRMTADAVRAAKQKKDNCKAELARLKAARDAANTAQKTANATAKSAQSAADKAAQEARDAQQHLDNYDADLAAADAADKHALEAVNAQIAARKALKKAVMKGTPAYKASQDSIDAAVKAKADTFSHYQKVRRSKQARKDAAKNAKKDANAKRQQAEQANQAATNAALAAQRAEAALHAKERLCKQLSAQLATAQSDLAAARAAADKARQNARAQVRDALDKKIDKKKRERDNCYANLGHRAYILQQMSKALKDIGAIGGKPVQDRKLDFKKDLKELVTTTIVDGVAELANVATVQVFTILDSLKAGYGIVDILRLDLTPARSGYNGDANLQNWLLNDKHYAADPKEAAEIQKEMTRFMNHGGNTKYLKKEWQQQKDKCQKLEDELNALRAKRDKLP